MIILQLIMLLDTGNTSKIFYQQAIITVDVCGRDLRVP